MMYCFLIMVYIVLALYKIENNKSKINTLTSNNKTPYQMKVGFNLSV